MTGKTFKGTMNDGLVLLVCLVWLKTQEQYLPFHRDFGVRELA